MKNYFQKPRFPLDYSWSVAVAVYLRRLIFFIIFLLVSFVFFIVLSWLFGLIPINLILYIGYVSVVGALAVSFRITEWITSRVPMFFDIWLYKDKSYEYMKATADYILIGIGVIIALIIGLLVLGIILSYSPIPIPFPLPNPRPRRVPNTVPISMLKNIFIFYIKNIF